MIIDPNVSYWYCLRSKKKNEHLGSRQVLNVPEVEEVFCPQIRFQKNTRRGRIWFTEAMFPSYLFAKFPLSHVRHVRSRIGIVNALNFGGVYPNIPESFILDLKSYVGEDDLITVSTDVTVGDSVEVVRGPLQGLECQVVQLLSGSDRVKILLEFFGRQVEGVVAGDNVRKMIFA
jgi:transcriptional antiterminator RfaH